MELITILQPTETCHYLTGPLAYSPDGRSIACASNTAILIWDIQTGGVAKEIECSPNSTSLVWSLDGQTICTINPELDQAAFVVHTYNISSSIALSPGTLHPANNSHLWTYDKSFRIMTIVRDRGDDNAINIFEVGSTLTKIRSFTFTFSASAKIGSFSPTTHHISISDYNGLHIFDTRNSKRLLHEIGRFRSHCFSSDGGLFAASDESATSIWKFASDESAIHIWKYTSGDYTLWSKFRCQRFSDSPLLFSPTPSSILGHPGNILQVWHLPGFSIAPETRQLYAGLSRSGTRIATAHKSENTVTIVDLLAQTPPQYINTGVEIDGLVITGNVLLVVGSQKLTAWLLTDEGLVDSVTGDRRVSRSDSIWTLSPSGLGCESWMFRAEGQAGVIKFHKDAVHVYHTETGEVLDPGEVLHSNRSPPFIEDWDNLSDAVPSQ